MRVILSQPRGFCAGVDRAIEIVERALQVHGTPIYVRHEVVHNKYVVEDLRTQARYSSRICRKFRRAAPSSSARTASRKRCGRTPRRAGLRVFDATCPLVTKVHVEWPGCASRAARSS
jgi:4-hydroxy-3-methylbut-2-enyl diphosphate reductase